MHVIGTECARFARRYYKGLVARTMLLKTTDGYDEGSRRLTVVVKAGRLPCHPADHPNVMVRTLIQPLIPAMFGAQPDPIQPSIRRRKQRHDTGEFLGRFRDRAG